MNLWLCLELTGCWCLQPLTDSDYGGLHLSRLNSEQLSGKPRQCVSYLMWQVILLEQFFYCCKRAVIWHQPSPAALSPTDSVVNDDAVLQPSTMTRTGTCAVVVNMISVITSLQFTSGAWKQVRKLKWVQTPKASANDAGRLCLSSREYERRRSGNVWYAGLLKI